MVHLVDDMDGKWYPLELYAGGGPVGCQFDAVADSHYGTTIDIDDSLILYPVTYCNENQP